MKIKLFPWCSGLGQVRKRYYCAVASIVFFMLFGMFVSWKGTGTKRTTVTGEVFDNAGPVAGATVRWQGSATATMTDDAGRFQLPMISTTARITASKSGYYIAGSPLQGGPVRLTLERIPDVDSLDYHWVDPDPSLEKPGNCGNCHKAIYDEWQGTGHANAGQNRRFLDFLGQGRPQSRWHKTWNLRAENPDGVSVCGSCHSPTETPTFVRDDRDPSSGGLASVHCDFCHKILGPGQGEYGLAHGRYQLELRRPSQHADGGRQLFFGPLDDVDRGDDTLSSFQRDSRLCAACHEGVVFGVPVYSTYSEWQNSRAPSLGLTCQGCHMRPTGALTNIAPEHGGHRRFARTLASHNLFVGSKKEMLQKSFPLTVQVQHKANGVSVWVQLRSKNIGHKSPTGYIDRQLLLLVQGATGARNQQPLEGPLLPAWIGGRAAGQPGKLYAKSVARDNQRPAPFWRADPATLIDTRLLPEQLDVSNYLFPHATQTIHVRFIYRRFWPAVVQEKGWPDESILLFDKQYPVPVCD